jgi:hypothetical protein
MREISLDDNMTDLPVVTVLTYGDTKSGKTTFAATWPRALILADAVERGYGSIKTADRSQWFEPDYKPVVIAIENLGDLVQLMAPGGRVDQMIAAGTCRTIVVDALSYLIENMLNAIIQMQTKPDNRAAYGDLGKQLRNVRTMIQSKPVSVIWNCITKHPDEDDPRGRPSIPGKQGEAWPGACDFVFRSQATRKRELVDVEVEGTDGKTKIVKQSQLSESFFINTRQNGAYMAGHRLGIKADSLPDPFVGSYSDFVACLGYDVEALRKIVKQPPLKTIARPVNSPTITPVKGPPIVVNRSPPKVVTVPPQANNNKR